MKGPGVGLLGFSKGGEVSLAMTAFKNITAVDSPVQSIPIVGSNRNIPSVTVTLIPLCYQG